MKNYIKQYIYRPMGDAIIYDFRDEQMSTEYHVEVQRGRWTAALVSSEGDRMGVEHITTMDELSDYLDRAFEAVSQKLNLR